VLRPLGSGPPSSDLAKIIALTDTTGKPSKG
jgi:hypothetical protein